MSATQHYSKLDRMLHTAAFAGIGVQKVVAEIEDSLFKSQLDAVTPGAPIFVTSLPRAGTTLVLELLAKLPAAATHTYRQMPFLLCPMLWENISRGFRRDAMLAERAHGDGMEIGFDSPEAFEEAIWQAFWPEKYGPDCISTWTGADHDEDFAVFFQNHMKKIIAVRQQTEPRARRYISKNNGNIARIAYLLETFPRAHVVVPVREPLAHITSLLAQHKRFSDMHAADSFARDYMRSIGHFDFGANLMPIAFGAVSGGPTNRFGAETLQFWLDYWIAAFSHLAALKSPRVRILSYERLCTAPEEELGKLLACIGEDKPGLAQELALLVRQGGPNGVEDPGLDPDRLACARDIHHALLSCN